MLKYELFNVNPSDIFNLKNKKKVLKEFKSLPLVFHAHEVVDSVFHLVFQLDISKYPNKESEVEFLNCFYFFKDKLMFVERDFWLDSEFKKMSISKNLVTTNNIGEFTLKYDIHTFVEDLKEFLSQHSK